jgi:hypothetical protein
MFTAEAERWWMGLPAVEAERAAKVIDMFEADGSELGRKRLKGTKSSRHREMHELRPNGSTVRILLAFKEKNDREAVVLTGGDKAGNWVGWYQDQVPRADRLYDRHARNAGKETTWRELRSRGERSAASGR